MGAVYKLVSVAGITASGSVTVMGFPHGGHKKAVFLIDVTEIGAGDTWRLDLKWHPLGNLSGIANVGVNSTLTATGIVEVTLQAPFSSANRATPHPTHYQFTRSVAGASPTLTADVYAIYGD